MDIKEPASTSQSLPTIRPEERLRGVVAMVNGIKNALEGGVGASKEACARAAASLMDKGPQLLVDVRLVFDKKRNVQFCCFSFYLLAKQLLAEWKGEDVSERDEARKRDSHRNTKFACV